MMIDVSEHNSLNTTVVPHEYFGKSIILPVHNADQWLQDCLDSVLVQTFTGTLELSVFNDASTDESAEILKKFIPLFHEKDIRVVLSGHNDEQPRGVGHAKNQAIQQSSGHFLCFLDADDVMDEKRIELEYRASQLYPNAIVGCGFIRQPVNSTERYTKWANSLSQEQLYTQAYTSHGPTVIMPSWFCKRDVFMKVGQFVESGKGCPEDLIFFYEHLKLGGQLFKVNERLMTYRYHQGAASFSVNEETIWKHRVNFFQERVLSSWSQFTIWNAGKLGKRLFRSLTPDNQRKVKMFCDVDDKKIDKGFYTYEESKEKPKPQIPIVHYQNALPPLVICVKQDLTGGVFEAILSSLALQEGTDYFHFG